MLKSTILALTVLAAACGSSPPAEKKTAAPSTAAADAKAGCVKLRLKQRECTSVFIPALVDMRVKVDIPPGIAAAAKTEGRDKLVAQAHGEWKNDSTDESIAAMCERMPMPPGVTAAQREAVEKCMSVAECDAFVGCFLPVLEEIMRSNAARR